MITVRLPLMIVSEANTREHWAKHHRRHSEQRRVSAILVAHAIVWSTFSDPVKSVTLTRVMDGRQRAYDSDNLAAALKSVRDGVADGLGIGDGWSGITWRYDQRRRGPGDAAWQSPVVVVEIE